MTCPGILARAAPRPDPPSLITHVYSCAGATQRPCFFFPLLQDQTRLSYLSRQEPSVGPERGLHDPDADWLQHVKGETPVIDSHAPAGPCLPAYPWVRHSLDCPKATHWALYPTTTGLPTRRGSGPLKPHHLKRKRQTLSDEAAAANRSVRAAGTPEATRASHVKSSLCGPASDNSSSSSSSS